MTAPPDPIPALHEALAHRRREALPTVGGARPPKACANWRGGS